MERGPLTTAHQPHAQKVRNLRSSPNVMLALGDPAADFDVVLVEAHAALDPVPARLASPGLA